MPVTGARDAERSSRARPSPAGRRIWLVFVERLASRVFFECGIVEGLARALPERLAALFMVHEQDARPWLEGLPGIELLDRDALFPDVVGPRERVLRRLDAALDARFGFYPLAVRHSLRHGFHEGRWARGHEFPFLDSERVGPLPRGRALDALLARRHLSRRRYAPSALLRRLRSDCEALVLTNPQAHLSVPFLTAARRLRLPTVGYIASWDHPVGKGIVSPHLDVYVVQNETMREDLRRYHSIDPSRVVVTGWPQADAFHRRRPREAYRELLRELGLPPDRPAILFAGNTPHNAPYEGNLVGRLVAWWRESGAGDRLSLVVRPHPYDREADERFAAAVGVPGIAVQKRSFTDFEALATLLQHCDCVVANAGTILLDALVNDRPSVCVLYDEGAPAGESWAVKNVLGEHYRELARSRAFYRAGDFEEVVEGIERALANPGELADERRRVTREVVGEADGRAAERVVDAIVDVVVSVSPGRSVRGPAARTAGTSA